VSPQERKDMPWIVGAFVLVGFSAFAAMIHRLF
jgi:hypothetical protein